MRKTVKLIQKSLKSAGVEIIPYPHDDRISGRNILRSVLNKLAINCVLDVGGNHGQYGSMLRDLGYQGQIVSFEPVRASFEVLSACAQQRGPWSAFQYALGRSERQAEINVTNEDVFSSFLKPRGDSLDRFPCNRIMRSEKVSIRRLDAVLHECVADLDSPRIYLKLDTQGFDLEVLAGARGVMDVILALQTEVSFRPIYHGMPGYQTSLQAFQASGFGVVDFMPDIGDLCAIEMDCIMAKTLEYARPE